MKKTVEAECGSCRGTGLYIGTCEQDGVAVVCNKCNGEGKAIITYTPFTSRHGREGITTVKFVDGEAFCEHGKNSVSYEEFLSGKMPS